MKIDVCFTSFKNYGHVKNSYFKVCNNIININGNSIISNGPESKKRIGE